MREIEYRAWLKDEKKMVKVDAIDFRQKIIFYTEEREIDGEIIDTLQTRKFNEIELMQYTMLKDNNNDEIYEEDIVEILTEVEEYGVVKFSDGAFYVEADGFRVNFYDNIVGGDVVVIGNIYENPELLPDLLEEV